MMKWHRLLVGLLLCGLLSTLVAACAIRDVRSTPAGPTVHMCFMQGKCCCFSM